MDLFQKLGLQMNVVKTDVMWVGKQRDELNIRLEGKYIKQVTTVAYIWEEIHMRTGEWPWK